MGGAICGGIEPVNLEEMVIEVSARRFPKVLGIVPLREPLRVRSFKFTRLPMVGGRSP